jgi:hypothetical protein
MKYVYIQMRRNQMDEINTESQNENPGHQGQKVDREGGERQRSGRKVEEEGGAD